MQKKSTLISVASAWVLLVGTAACFAACSGESSEIATCDPATDPTCAVDGSTDGTLLDDGTIVLPDGRVIPADGTGPDGTGPDGAPTDGGPTDGVIPPWDGSGCKTLGTTCTAGTECCSTYCIGGVCAKSSFCSPTGDGCLVGTDCCGGICTAGRCEAPPKGPSYCGKVDGELCGACNDCCSRVCAPYGTTGIKVCQPAGGCHVIGDLCRKDVDCCGAPGTGLPGAGSVVCEKATATAEVGICRNPTGCNPSGAVCHYKSAATCGTDSARNDCCDALGTKGTGVCKPDPMGVPRCNGGGPCVPKTGVCSYSGDCCDLAPCVPDASGIMHCYPGPCVPKEGPCTVDGDCCLGATCIRPPGSATGSCKPVSLPPPPPTDGGVSDSGVPPSDATSDVPCALFGQTCTKASDCCSDVPCVDKVTGLLCTGGTTCTCHFPLK